MLTANVQLDSAGKAIVNAADGGVGWRVLCCPMCCVGQEDAVISQTSACAGGPPASPMPAVVSMSGPDDLRWGYPAGVEYRPASPEGDACRMVWTALADGHVWTLRILHERGIIVPGGGQTYQAIFLRDSPGTCVEFAGPYPIDKDVTALLTCGEDGVLSGTFTLETADGGQVQVTL